MTRAEKLADIKNNPDKHKHPDMNTLNRCCFMKGALDLMLIDAHSRYASQDMNGGRRCDVSRGPCSCGAWH